MNYTIKTLISVLVLAIVVLLTAVQVNTQPEARSIIGMSTETEETTKSAVVRVKKDTAKTNEPSAVVAQNESADSDTSEETSGVPQLKFPVVKRNRFMTEVN